MSNVIVKMDSKVLDDLVRDECQHFAIYLRDNWQPYESPSNDIWWNKKTGVYDYTYLLYFHFKQSQSKEKVND